MTSWLSWSMSVDPVFVKLKFETPSIASVSVVRCLLTRSALHFLSEWSSSFFMPSSRCSFPRGFSWTQTPQLCLLTLLHALKYKTEHQPIPNLFQVPIVAKQNLNHSSAFVVSFPKAKCLGRIFHGSQQVLTRSHKVANLSGNRKPLLIP